MVRWLGLALVLVGCGEANKDVDTADTSAATGTGGGGSGTGGTPCSPSAGDDLADPTAGLDAQAEACSSSPYWEVAYMATTFFVGDFSVDECGNVTGRERWVLYMGPKMLELDYVDCEVVWDVTGTLPEPLAEGDTAITMNAVVNAALSTCKPNDDGVEIYVGEEDVELSYTVITTVDGAAEFRFSGSGDTLGFGQWNANNATYTSGVSCKAF
ncbi:MAG: hypothetical protein ACI8PZ_003316 [Myxococcota bacterium]|jgi:hypothetical protein